MAFYFLQINLISIPGSHPIGLEGNMTLDRCSGSPGPAHPRKLRLPWSPLFSLCLPPDDDTRASDQLEQEAVGGKDGTLPENETHTYT